MADDPLNQPKVKNIEKYMKILRNSLHCSMVPKNQLDFYAEQNHAIRSAIEDTLKFVDKYDYQDEEIKENVRMYAVTCLPFLLANFTIINPDIETRESHKQAIEWLLYIKNNRGMANQHIHSITSDKSKGKFSKEELDSAVEDGIKFNYHLNKWERFERYNP